MLSSPTVDFVVNKVLNYLVSSLGCPAAEWSSSSYRRHVSWIQRSSSPTVESGGYSTGLLPLSDARFPFELICMRFFGTIATGISKLLQTQSEFLAQNLFCLPPMLRSFIELTLMGLIVNEVCILISSLSTFTPLSRLIPLYMFIQHDVDLICLQLLTGIFIKL